jgi:hypothetical protein
MVCRRKKGFQLEECGNVTATRFDAEETIDGKRKIAGVSKTKRDGTGLGTRFSTLHASVER